MEPNKEPEKNAEKTTEDATEIQAQSAPVPVKTRKLNRTKVITYSAALSALGMIVVLFMPPIVIDPPAAIMTVTIGSHVAVFIGMLIHPIVGVSTALVTACTYLIKPTLPFPGSLAVFLRALSHLAFVIPMSFIAQKWLNPKEKQLDNKQLITRGMTINGITAAIHMVAEVVAVSLAYLIFTLAINLFPVNIDPFYVFVVVGLITFTHSVIDFLIAFAIYIPLRRARIFRLYD